MDEKEKKVISTTAFSFFMLFVVIAMVFILARNYIAGFNVWCLAMTHEITIAPPDPNQVPEQVKIKQQQFKQANTINKVKAPAPAAVNQHATRKTPPEKGTYTTSSSESDDTSTIFVGSKAKIVNNPQNWKDTNDLSYRAKLFRLEKGFLVIVVVKDDVLWAKDESIQHQNDCVEIYFDVRPKDTRGKDKYEPGVYHALIVPCFGMKKNANTMIFHFDKDDPMPPGCYVKSNVVPEGYRVEAFFPYTMFKYQPEEEFNFDIGVIDYDGNGNFCQMVLSGSAENYKGAMWFGKMKPAKK